VWKVLRAIAPGLVLTMAAIGLMVMQRRLSAPAPEKPADAARPRSVYEAKTDELLRLNAGMASEPRLAEEYYALNVRYFDGHLPDVRVRWEPRLAGIGPLIAEGFRLDGLTNGRLILLDPAIEDDKEIFRRTLAHEMVHVAVRDRDDAHGPVFQRELRRLSDAGAFSGIVATEDEKEEMRRSIETTTGNLEREIRELGHERVALNADTAAPNPNVADLNARIADYNARVKRHNDAVNALNDRIAQYNLMISYPDGLDRERLNSRATLPPTR
jgi:hypothetical protein